jgi:ribosomal protein S18 acetylase RimI-like enzyme
LWENPLKGYEALSYRTAKVTDFALIAEMEKLCFNKYDIFKPYQVRRFLKNPVGTIISDIITLGGKPAGWASWFTRKNSDKIRLYSICIHPDFSGKGYAREYLKIRLSSFKDKRAVTLEVRADNKRAIGLYQGLGFSILKKLPGYYLDDGHGLKMIKYLDRNI